MNLTEQTLEQFIESTASGEAVPGGGSISALCAALSAALSTMVCRLTSGKKKYADHQERIETLISYLDPMAKDLLNSVDLDSQAYDEVFKAYKLPKDSDEQKALRAECIQKALKIAAAVPLSVAASATSLLPLIEEITVIGNKNAITDAYVAAQCARTAILGATANVRINLQSITDTEYVEKALASVKLLEHQALETEERIRQSVLAEI